MKVYIGPYKNYIGPYQIADTIFFWVDRKTLFQDDSEYMLRWDYRACDKLGDWLADSWVNDLCLWIQEKRGNQKIKIRIDKHDTWNMDETLAHIILPMLKQLRATKHGSCLVDDKDVPKHLRSTAAPPEEKEWNADSLVHDRWDWVLDEMIFAFEHKLNEDWRDNFFRDDNLKGIHVVQKRISNGFRLFGKYYTGLWD